MKLRKLFTKDWVHDSPGRVSGGGGKVWEACEIGYIIFGGLLLGGSNAERWSDHKKKKFFINNSVEVKISFK